MCNKSDVFTDEDLHANVLKETLSSGSSWIAFKWQASTETCRQKIGSYIVKESSSNEEYRCSTAWNDIVAFNTSMECFKQTIIPCRDYSFSLALVIGQAIVGRTTTVNRTTLYEETVMPYIKPDIHGLDWFTFKWKLSDENCNKYIDSYSLNVTEFVTNTVKSQSFIHTDCSENVAENFFLFNSSCSDANLSIARCSRYFVTISSNLSINNEPYALLSPSSIQVETLSGKMLFRNACVFSVKKNYL